MGGSSGEIWELEGSGSQDGGSADILSERVSKLFALPRDAAAFDISGWVSYRGLADATLTLTFQHGGRNLFDHDVTISIAAPTNFGVYNGAAGDAQTSYYNESDSSKPARQYYNSEFRRRLIRHPFDVASDTSHIQVRARIDGAADFDVTEIGIRFDTAQQGAP